MAGSAASCRRLGLVVVLGAASLAAAGGNASAQQLIDHVVARVNGVLVLLSDVRAAAGFGLIEPGPEPDQVRQMVQRQLLLGEASRFPPPEPSPEELAAEVVRMTDRVTDPVAFMASQGLSRAHVRALARDSLQIQAYLAQRFGPGAPVSDEAALEYYKAHLAEFTRDGMEQPFQDVQGVARERAATERRREAVNQWLRDLEGRADVVLPRK